MLIISVSNAHFGMLHHFRFSFFFLNVGIFANDY